VTVGRIVAKTPPPDAPERRILARLKAWAARLKRDVVALWLAARDPRTPLAAKALAALVAAYALSPIDLIPDFMPVLGYLDDLIIVPLGVALAVRLIPSALMAEFRRTAEQRLERPKSRLGAAAVVVLWVAVGILLARWVWRRFG
jgi:uncharacterized membrane protein YkvA (DUF1232 family)